MFIFIGKLHMHLVKFEPITTPSTHTKMSFDPGLIGYKAQAMSKSYKFSHYY